MTKRKPSWEIAAASKPLGRKGQSTIEYLLMVGFGAIFSLQVAQFFNDIFRDGLSQLEQNVSSEVQTGRGFGGGAR